MKKYLGLVNLSGILFFLFVIAMGVVFVYKGINALDTVGMIMMIFFGGFFILLGATLLIISLKNIKEGGSVFRRTYETFTDYDFNRLKEDFWNKKGNV